jgi:hypothetical protein
MGGVWGAGTYNQLNAIIWASYGRPGETLEDFTEMMRQVTYLTD